MAGSNRPDLKQLLTDAIRKRPGDREAFLASACRGDAALRAELCSLLAAHDAAGRFLDSEPALTTGTVSELGTHANHEVSSTPTGRLLPGATINGRYLVEGIAGEGGMGSVYRVRDQVTSNTLALKMIRGRPQFVNLFKIEFRTLVELRHPHLARCYDFAPIAGTTDYCFTMDYVAGCNLFDATCDMAWPAIVDMVVPVCRVLAYVHSRGIVHRDLKPNNLLVARDGTVKLVDFGLAGSGGLTDYVMGTPAYMAPELGDRGRSDHRSDLYSLGILVYQLVFRRLPFASISLADVLYQHAYAPLGFPEGTHVPSWLTAVILRLCSKQPADRFRSANQVIEAINAGSGARHPLETLATRESYVLSGRFVGRDGELSSLLSFVDRRLGAADSVEDPFALVSGGSGVGKSRLMRELRHAVQLNRQVFVEGNCFEGAAAEYGPFAEVIEQLVPLIRAQGGGPLLDRSLGELVKVVPNLEKGFHVASALPLVSPEAERRRLLDTIAAFLIEASRLCPYVLYINDLQWAGQGAIDVLIQLRRGMHVAERRRERVALAVVGSYRDDEVEGRPVATLLDDLAPRAAVLHLDPLPSTAMRSLVESMFGLDDIPGRFITRVLEEASGSPFFLEEIVRVLVENGSVFVEGSAWRTAATLGDLEIPATIVATVRRRLAMLVDPLQLRVLRILAAHQKPLSVLLVAAIADVSAEDAQAALHQLSKRHLTAALGESDHYRTAHDHVRKTVYDDVGSAAPSLHLQIARALELASGGTWLSELAHHYWLARESEPALMYALKAGESALTTYANGDAIEHLEHALSLMSPDSNPARLKATEQLADAHFLSGHYDRTQSLLRDVDNRVEATLDRARIRRKIAEAIGYSAGTPAASLEMLWTAAEQLGAKRPRTPASVMVRSLTAASAHFIGRVIPRIRVSASARDERLRLTELAGIYLRMGYFSFFADPLLVPLPIFRAANIVDRLGESREHSEVYATTALAFADLGFWKRGVQLGNDAIAEALRIGSPWHLANARGVQGMILLQCGRWAQAAHNAELSREGFAACGDHFHLAISLYVLLDVLYSRGELAAAIARGREELAVFDRLGLQIIGKGAYAILAQALAKAGDADGIAIAKDVLARAEQGRDTLCTAWAHVALGDALLHFNEVDEAIDHLEQAVAIRDRHKFLMYVVGPASALLVRAYAAKLRWSRVALSSHLNRSLDRHVSQAVTVARLYPPLRCAAYLARAIRWHVRGRPERAGACFDQSIRAAEQLGAPLWRADAHFEYAMTLRAEGKRDGSAAQLEQALGLFRACGGQFRQSSAQG